MASQYMLGLVRVRRWENEIDPMFIEELLGVLKHFAFWGIELSVSPC